MATDAGDMPLDRVSGYCFTRIETCLKVAASLSEYTQNIKAFSNPTACFVDEPVFCPTNGNTVCNLVICNAH